MKNLFKPNKLTKDQFDRFFVGLLEGNGSIQVNHWKMKCLQYRFVIKLSDKPLNYDMLKTVHRYYGRISYIYYQ